MHVVRGPWEVAERHGAGHLSRCTARAAHGRPGPARRQARQVATHHPFGLSRTKCPANLVRRHFEAFASNGLWVADIPPQAGGTPPMGVPSRRWVYVAFVTDVLRRIVGSQTTCRPVCTDLVLEPLRWPFGSENTRELISGSSASLATVGCSTSLVRYGQALVDCGAVASVGSKGKSFRLCSGRARSSSLVQGRAHLLARAPAH